MLIKPLKNKGRGSPKAVLRYLLNKPEGQVRVLSGDPKLSQQIAESLSYSQSYEAWVLSFEEQELSDDVKRSIMREFEKSFLPFFQDNPERYNITWIEHSDKGRVELNFFMPKVDLLTEKQISLFNASHRSDYELMNNFRDFINAHYGLSNPMDKAKAKLVKGADWLNKAKSDHGLKAKELIEGISNAIEEMLRSGKISNRDDVISVLSESGFEITRVSRSSVSIKNPNGKNNLKLKGVLFDESFTSLAAASENIDRRDEISVRGRVNGIDTHSKSDFSEPLIDFREKLDKSIEYRRKTQQRAFGDVSERGRAFKHLRNGFSESYDKNARDRKSGAEDHANSKDFRGIARASGNIEDFKSEHDPSEWSVREDQKSGFDSFSDIPSHDDISSFYANRHEERKGNILSELGAETRGNLESYTASRAEFNTFERSEREPSARNSSSRGDIERTEKQHLPVENISSSERVIFPLYEQRIDMYKGGNWGEWENNSGSQFSGIEGIEGAINVIRTNQNGISENRATTARNTENSRNDFEKLSADLGSIKHRAEQYRAINNESGQARTRYSNSDNLSGTARAFTAKWLEVFGARHIISRAIEYAGEFKRTCEQLRVALQRTIEQIEQREQMRKQLEEQQRNRPVTAYSYRPRMR
ncbi:TPA: hypothetical protein ACS78G_004243 [Providencia alcalifaciens]